MVGNDLWVVGREATPTDSPPAGAITESSRRKSVEVNPAAFVNGKLSIQFSYNYVSEEYPEYGGTAYNDDFVARIRAKNGTVYELAKESVNATTFYEQGLQVRLWKVSQ